MIDLKFRHFFFFREFLECKKYVGADFNYEKGFLNFFPKNNKGGYFWSQI